MIGTKLVGNKDNELSMKPITAIYPFKLFLIKPSLLKSFKENIFLNFSLLNKIEFLREI